MPQNPHISVLPEETVSALEPTSGKIYLDGTLGAGGHTELLLERSKPDGRVIAIDRDLSAIDIAKERLGESAKRVDFVHGTFGELQKHLDKLNIGHVDGMLLDLGVSSMQIDQPERGFSFMHDGPIDMRMDTSRGETALEFISSTDPDTLANVIYQYGEERFSRRIAAALHEAALKGELQSTSDLAQKIADQIPNRNKRTQRIHPATRTFQALRIAVNAELDQLEFFLRDFVEKLEFGARCAIISFHSLEDRMVKHRFRDLAQSSSLPPDLAVEAGERPYAICKAITRKPMTATSEEIDSNPRSRSAKLRVCEKLRQP